MTFSITTNSPSFENVHLTALGHPFIFSFGNQIMSTTVGVIFYSNGTGLLLTNCRNYWWVLLKEFSTTIINSLRRECLYFVKVSSNVQTLTSLVFRERITTDVIIIDILDRIIKYHVATFLRGNLTIAFAPRMDIT